MTAWAWRLVTTVNRWWALLGRVCGASNNTLWTMSFSHWEALRYRDHINKLRITMFVNDLLLFLVKLSCVVQLQLSSHGDAGDNTISHRPSLIFIILLPAYFELYVSSNLGSCTSCLSANCNFPIGRNITVYLCSAWSWCNLRSLALSIPPSLHS